MPRDPRPMPEIQRDLSSALNSSPAYNVARIRNDFPILTRHIDGRPIIYLDSAATSLKPQCVIDAIVEFYESYTSNVKRGVHRLADEASERFEKSRDRVASFINADAKQIVFVRNTTEAINLVAQNIAPEARVLWSLIFH